jgi:hypothetical protein
LTPGLDPGETHRSTAAVVGFAMLNPILRLCQNNIQTGKPHAQTRSAQSRWRRRRSACCTRLGRGADHTKTLVFVPTSDLAILDPVVTGARPTRNSAYLVFDTLYGIDTNWKA